MLGGIAALLAIGALLDMLFVPSERSEQVFFGYMVSGPAARAATTIHLVAFLWAAWACFKRKAFMANVVIGYCLYLVVSLWIWTSLYGSRLEQSGQTIVMVNVLASVVLLVVARVTFGRRAAFDQ